MAHRSMSEFFSARYRIACSRDAIEARAQALALEQSVELPLAGVRDASIRERIVARVEAVTPVAGSHDGAQPAGQTAAAAFDVTLALATATTALEPSQLLNMLFGNCSLQPEVSLIDAEIPPSLVRAIGGPRFGIAGIRRVTGVAERAITCCALKPQGLSPAAMAELAGQLARAGVDVIKDDHGIADQAYAPFDERVPLIRRAVERANRDAGCRAVYAPTLSGPPARLAAQARLIAAEGVGMALACPALIGYSCLVELVRERLTVPVIAHPALAGGRIAPSLLLGKLFRLFGADAVIYPNHGGRFAWTPGECRAVADAARAPMHGMAPAMPVPAGGMRIDRVEEMLAFYGADTMLLIGGDVLVAGDVEARAREFVTGVARASAACGAAALSGSSAGVAPAARLHGHQDRAPA